MRSFFDRRPLFLSSTIFYARQATASRERALTDTRYAVAYYHARQATAIIERIIPDTRYAVTYYHARQAVAFIERTIRNITACYRYFL